jgi:HEAT repeat protein
MSEPMRRSSTVALVMALLCFAPAPRLLLAADSVQGLLDTGALKTAYNPVLLEFLTEEGKGRLPEAQRKAALEQLVAGFREHAKITPGAQATAALASLAGLVTKGTVSQGISEGAAQVWTEWVDAAFVVQKAGYKEESSVFFENCVQNFPYDELRARCAVGLAQADADKAFTVLVGLLDKKYGDDVNAVALRMLGDLAATPGLPAEKKDAALDELTKRTQGFSNVGLNAAAVEGLVRSKDPRAVETIRKFTKGMMHAEDLKHAALRGLLLGFNDAGALDALQKQLKGGFMKEPKDQVWAALILIEAGQQAGYDWAVQYATGKKKGNVDYSDELVQAMIDAGGTPAKDALNKVLAAGKPGEWQPAYIAIALLNLGDDSHLDLVKAALGNEKWPYTRVQAAVALARHGDMSGLPVLKTLLEPAAAQSLLKSAANAAIGKQKPDPDAIRSTTTRALGTIDAPEVVPLLVSLLDDKSDRVRLSAAYALANMRNPAALDGLSHALEVDYGKEENRPRAPEVKATVVRWANLRFEKDPRTRALLQKASGSEITSVKFLALAAMKGGAEAHAEGAAPASATASKPAAARPASKAAARPAPKASPRP